MLIRRRKRFEQFREAQKERQARGKLANDRGGKDTAEQSNDETTGYDSNHKQEPAEVILQGGSIVIKEEPSSEPNLSRDDSHSDGVAKLKSTIINHDAKIKKDSQFDLQTVYDRLKTVGTELFPIDLDEETKYFGVRREFISNLYGGGWVATFPRIDPEKASLHGIDNFAFLNLDYNPHAPVVPGAPGLFTTLGGPASVYRDYRIRDSKWYRVFVSIQKDGLWTYMGNYLFSLAPSLTASEFAIQSTVVKRTWGRSIHERKWGQDAIARIILRRKLAREPTKEETEAQRQEQETEEKKRPQKKSKNGKTSAPLKRDTVTDEDVIEALLTGKEELGVYCMKCIEYDVEFQQFLKRTFFRSQRKKTSKVANSKPSSSDAPERTPDAGVSPASKTKGKPTGKKRKLAERNSDDSDTPSQSDVGDGDSEVEEVVHANGNDDREGHTRRKLVYHPRGTRSRPGGSKSKAIRVD
ncbi:hypothetical protein K474DRAFT_1131071 [Panus rudis PR-1116 ss-1]|nr:hypothetical protein K474DRAFT_1131071 [Panus rudis PR-1116 ss-1]